MSDTQVVEAEVVAVPVAPSTEGTEVAVVEQELIEVQTEETIHAVRPKFLSDEDNDKIIAQAKELAKQVVENPTDIQVTTIIYALGGDAMENNTNQTGLIETKVGPVLANVTAQSPVQTNLLEIKSQFDLVTPATVAQTEVEFTSTVQKAKFLVKAFGTKAVTEVVKRLPMGDKEVMTVINSRKDSVGDMINGIKRHLLSEKDIALKQAIALAQIANKLYDIQEDLQTAAYQGQLIWEQVNEARDAETDLVRQQSMLYLVNDLATLVVDIQSVDQLNMQTRMSAETLINNCRSIQSLVGRITNRLLPAVQNALMVKAAGMQQASLAAASRDVIAGANATMEATAKDIGQVSVQIAQMNADSMLDMDALVRTQEEYEKTQNELLEIMNNAEVNARGISNKMSEINAKSRQRADPMTQARQARDKAVNGYTYM